MSFVINTTVDKNQELLDAYKELYENSDSQKDVYLISKNNFIAVDSFALALSSDFFKTLLSENQRDTVNILIPDVEPEILRKVVEYIYCGAIEMESKYMADFIEACNLLNLKATITCEKKLVFDSQKSATFTSRATSTPMTAVSKQANLDSLIADLEQDEQIEYRTKHESSEEPGQIVEVYEIEEGEITYEEEEISEHNYELMNVVSEIKSEAPAEKKFKKEKGITVLKTSPSEPRKPVDEDTMNKAIDEIMSNSNSFRVISEKYQIPKTLLWRRAKKMGYVKGEKLKDLSRVEAIEEIKRGESLISLSKKYNIPISTLHREKLKLYERGQLPDFVNLKNRSRGADYDDRLRVAISEILNGKSQNEIAKKYNIPKTTIWRIIKKMSPDYKSDNTVVTPESSIVEHLMQMSKKRTVKEEPIKQEPVEIFNQILT